MRIIVDLSSDAELKKVGTKTLTGGNMSKYGGNQTYDVWDIINPYSGTAYTITYNANGGTGGPTSQKWYEGKTVQLSLSEPTREGYKFLGWSTSKTATTSQHFPGKVLTTQAQNMTLYAVWEKKTQYTLRYDANGGTGAPSSQVWYEGDQLQISSTQPTRTGYKFLGWSTNKNATTSQHYSGKVLYNQVGNMTLYAVWEVQLPSTNYTKPYLPDGYTYVEGDLDSGLVIADSLGNEFVWIEVPRTTTVYPTTGINLGASFSDSYFASIERDLHAYTSTYRGTTSCSDTYGRYRNNSSASGLTETQYIQLYNSMLRSVYNNGGFYIGRYETGTMTQSTELVIKKHAVPYYESWVPTAQSLSTGFASNLSGYKSSLMFGVQWDLVMKYLETKGTNQYYLKTDSTGWGNYGNTQFTLYASGAQYKRYPSGEWTKVTSTFTWKPAVGKFIILTTGATDLFKKMNIYDLAGNFEELTLEYSGRTEIPFVARGGAFDVYGNSWPASLRGASSGGATHDQGFRVTLFKTSLY